MLSTKALCDFRVCAVAVVALSVAGCKGTGGTARPETGTETGGKVGIHVEPRTLPKASTDLVTITMEETYKVDGVGSDTVMLKGTLETRMGQPLFGFGQKNATWDTATVVAEFTRLDMRGKSDVFGDVHVTLDTTQPAFAAVTAGKCAAAMSVVASMPRLGKTLKTAQPMQLQSLVTSVPPIGDQKTVSVGAVALVDTQTGRRAGMLESARVMWRSLDRQTAYKTSGVLTRTTPIPALKPAAQPVAVATRTLPKAAGLDYVDVTMKETYDIEGVGKDTVVLKGTLVTRRAVPLLGYGEKTVDWDTSTVVAEFVGLDLKGQSEKFGDITVSLDKSQPSYAAVKAGDCAAAAAVVVDMAKLNMTLRTQTPMQLQSDVTTVPPIGDEGTKSVTAVKLVDKDGRSRGQLESAQVTWRTLLNQKAFATAL